MRWNTWNLDGVNITDMSALGSSPTYYDFESFQEVQASTGGSDVTATTPGMHSLAVTFSAPGATPVQVTLPYVFAAGSPLPAGTGSLAPLSQIAKLFVGP